MGTNLTMDVLVIGAGPSALSIAAALGQEKLKVGLVTNHLKLSEVSCSLAAKIILTKLEILYFCLKYSP